ncbi:NAD-dependent epimerase/dehydratase family protein [Dongia sedimenti]|uniref:NAD(P)-dependent oxidoreductase n=1 Tax=Dongia sedimenti TaxID=3064282 RepID=A0ABU0YT89_9PROT|nr:NAD(P)-dependent oxidoreductase [Rhodospirillaceae bacterium R-7]
MADRIVITGAAGLVGLNLIPRLKARGYADIVAIDKHPANVARVRSLHPGVTVIAADLALDDGWQSAIAGAGAIVISHAQIGGLDEAAFTANNVVATRRVLEAAQLHGVPYLVHLSSSAVNSTADDWYAQSKALQESCVRDAGIPAIVLRPTLMFGWFDRKHLGWLARFMGRSPLFPIPGDGRYLRQPLYVGDLCEIVAACLARRLTGVHDITGLERIDFIDLMRAVRDACGAHTPFVRVPYRLFWGLLFVYGKIDRNPPFTTRQLEALVTPDVFQVTDWPGTFQVTPTPLDAALAETFRDPRYSNVVLDF